jgi:hypothetical protein
MRTGLMRSSRLALLLSSLVADRPDADRLAYTRIVRTPLSSPPLLDMSQSDLVEVLASLQSQLAVRGASAFRTLELAFAVNDRDKNGTFDFAEVEAILAKAGLFLKVRTYEAEERGDDARECARCIVSPPIAR